MNPYYLKNVLAQRIKNVTLYLWILKEKGMMEESGIFFSKNH